MNKLIKKLVNNNEALLAVFALFFLLYFPLPVLFQAGQSDAADSTVC